MARRIKPTALNKFYYKETDDGDEHYFLFFSSQEKEENHYNLYEWYYSIEENKKWVAADWDLSIDSWDSYFIFDSRSVKNPPSDALLNAGLQFPKSLEKYRSQFLELVFKTNT